MRDQKLAILLCLRLGCPLQSTLGFIPSVTNSHLKSLKPFQANDVTKWKQLVLAAEGEEQELVDGVTTTHI